MLALDMEGEDPALVGAAFREARALWPRPFKLLARTAPSFDEATFPGNAAAAKRRTDTVAGALRPARTGSACGPGTGLPGGDPHLSRQGRLLNPFWDQLVSVAVKAGVGA